MSPIPSSRRPAPDAYDHLWPLLPVFAVFFAMIVFAVATDHNPVQGAFEAPAMPVFEPGFFGPSDLSVPSAVEAVARLPDAAAEPVPSF